MVKTSDASANLKFTKEVTRERNHSDAHFVEKDMHKRGTFIHTSVHIQGRSHTVVLFVERALLRNVLLICTYVLTLEKNPLFV